MPDKLCPNLKWNVSEILGWEKYLHCTTNRPINLELNLANLSFFPGYIGEFEMVDDHRNGKIVVNLNGRLNKVNFLYCSVLFHLINTYSFKLDTRHMLYRLNYRGV